MNFNEFNLASIELKQQTVKQDNKIAKGKKTESK